MNAALIALVAMAEENAMSRISYMGLARLAFESDNPTRAMISSVARAARTLERWDLATIVLDEHDRRRRWVAPSKWLLIGVEIQIGLASTSSAYRDDFSVLRLRETVSALRELYEEGLIEVEDCTGVVHRKLV